jgi:cell division protein FtsB
VEQPNIAKRFQEAVDETTSVKKRSPLFYVLILLLILAVSFDAYVRYGKVLQLQKEKKTLVATSRELMGKVNDFEEMVMKKDNEMFRLKTLLGPLETVALQRYPGDPEEALDKLGDHLDKEKDNFSQQEELTGQQRKEIKKLKRDNVNKRREVSKLKKEISKQKGEIAALSEMNEYIDVATWMWDGRIRLWDSQVANSPVAGWAKTFRQKRVSGKPQWKCGSTALFHYREMVEEYPKYPFPYYVLAKCLHAKGEKSWKEYARNGVSILEKTTRISGHASDHDDILAELQALLEKRDRQQ